MKQKLVVIGNGMAGMRTVEEVPKLAHDRYEICVFGAEPHGNYNRIMLSPVLAGEWLSGTSSPTISPWYQQNGIRLHFRARETGHSDPQSRTKSGVPGRFGRVL